MPSLVATWKEQIRRKSIQLQLVSVWRLPWYKCRKVLWSHFCFQSNCISLAETVIDFDPNTTGTHGLKDSAPLRIQTRGEACSLQSCALGTVSPPPSAPEVLVCVYNLSLISAHSVSYRIGTPAFYSCGSFLCLVSGSFLMRSFSIEGNQVFLLWIILDGNEAVNNISWSFLQDFFLWIPYGIFHIKKLMKLVLTEVKWSRCLDVFLHCSNHIWLSGNNGEIS